MYLFQGESNLSARERMLKKFSKALLEGKIFLHFHLSNFFLSSLETDIQNPLYLFRSSRILLDGTLEKTDSA